MMIPYPHREYWKYFVSSLILVICSYATILTDAAIGGYFLGEDAVSSINLILPVNELFYGIALLMGLGATVVGAISYGKEDITSLRIHFTVAITSTLTCLALLGVVMLIACDTIVDMLAGETNLHSMTYTYFIGMIPWFVVNGVLLVFKEFTILAGKPAWVMGSAVIQLMVNIICNMFFLGVLRLGIGSLALSSFLSASVMLTLLFVNYFSRQCPFRIIRCSPKKYLHYLRINIHYGSGFFFFDLSYILFAFLMNTLVLRLMGKEALFAWSVIVMAFYIANYAATAGQQTYIALGGRYRGMNEMIMAKRIHRLTCMLVAGLIVFLIIITGLFPNVMMPLYGVNDSVHYVTLLPVLVLAIPFIFGTNEINLTLLPMLQARRIVPYICLTAVSYLQLPFILLFFHYLLPGYEWYSFAAMIPVQLVLVYFCFCDD